MQDRFNLSDYVFLFVILALAGGARAGYLHWAVEDGRGKPAWQVQGKAGEGEQPKELEQLVKNWHEYGEFKCQAPLARSEEVTAHIAPAYSWIFSQVGRLGLDSDAMVMRWIQAGLGSLTAMLYFLFARRAFGSRPVALLAGLFAAAHPFWILNTAELHDGVLASFALALVLALGARGSQAGGVLTSLAVGLALAGLIMVRIAFLPFALAALVWYLLSCRKQRLGWLCALLACLGCATGLNPWIVRNYQTFDEPIPVGTSAFLHLWMGNNALATGAELDEVKLKASLRKDKKDERYTELLSEPNQAIRYNMLAHDVLDSVTAHPKETCERRISSGLRFLLGDSWFRGKRSLANEVNAPDWLDNYSAQTILVATLLGIFAFAFLGWRWSMSWRQQSRLAALAVIWVPLPYILSHAETLSGPRLPLDGVLLCLAAYALVGCGRKKQ